MNKKILPAFLLCFFLAPLGIHRFYAGKTGSGVAMLLLTLSIIGFPVVAVWGFVDLLLIALGNFKDGKGKLMTEWT